MFTSSEMQPASPQTGVPIREKRRKQFPLIDFSASTDQIRLGEPIRLQWNVAHADKVMILPGEEWVSPEGMMDIFPEASTEYTIVAINAFGRRESRLQFHLPAPVIQSFQTTEKNIQIEYPSIFHWEVDNGAKLRIEPEVGNVSSRSFHEAYLTQPGTYTLIAENASGRATAEVELALPLPEISDFFTGNDVIRLGQGNTLHWDIKNAVDITIEPEIGDVSGTTSVEVFPNQSSTYTLRAQNASGTVEASLSLTLPAPRIIEFGGSSELSTEGAPVELYWEVENAYQVILDQEIGEVPVSGSIKVKPTRAITQYHLLAIGHSGQAVQTFRLMKFPLPIEEDLLYPGTEIQPLMKLKDQEIKQEMPSLEDMEKEIQQLNQNHLRDLHIQRVQEMELTEELLAMEKASVRRAIRNIWMKLTGKMKGKTQTK
ncbi:MAG: hypothetical protein AAF206_04020 [Bacteroidota bacterium]